MKQARPWVEKYPTIPAPFERTLVEAAFYAEVARDSTRGRPDAGGTGRRSREPSLVSKTSAAAGDFTFIYTDGAMAALALAVLIVWLELASELTPRVDSVDTLRQSRDARVESRAHVQFSLRDDNGLDLDGITPGLRAAAREMTADRLVRERRHIPGPAVSVRWRPAGPRRLFSGQLASDRAPLRCHRPRVLLSWRCRIRLRGPAAHLMLARANRPISRRDERTIARRLNPDAGGGLCRRRDHAPTDRRRAAAACLDLDRKRALLGLSRRLVLEPGEGLHDEDASV